MTQHASAVCVAHQQHARPASASSSVSTAAPCDPIALACRIERMAAMQEGRLLAEAGSGRPFHGMRGEASANQRGGVSGHGGLAGLGGGDHGGLQLGLLGGHLAVSSTGGSPEGIFGGALGGLGLADLLEGHGWEAAGEALASDAHTVTRGGQDGHAVGGQFTIRNLWRMPEVQP